MILDNPVLRLVLKAATACGLVDRRLDAAASRDNRVEQKDSPFVLVGRAPNGRWGVFQRDFNNPRALFDEMTDACDYANELAKTRADSLVLIRKQQDSAVI